MQGREDHRQNKERIKIIQLLTHTLEIQTLDVTLEELVQGSGIALRTL